MRVAMKQWSYEHRYLCTDPRLLTLRRNELLHEWGYHLHCLYRTHLHSELYIPGNEQATISQASAFGFPVLQAIFYAMFSLAWSGNIRGIAAPG